MSFRFLVALTLSASCFAAPSLAVADDASSAYVIALPGGDTPRISFPKQGWSAARTQRRPDGSGVYHLLFNEASRLNFSAYIERRNDCGTPAGCLEGSLANPAYKVGRDLRRFDVGEFKAAELFIDRPGGLPFTQAHLLASAVVDGIWFDIHISKVGNEQIDTTSLVDLLRTVTIARP